MCRSKKFVNNVNENTSESDGCVDADYSVNMVSASFSSANLPVRDSLFVTLKIGPKSSKINFRVDTGSSAPI